MQALVLEDKRILRICEHENPVLKKDEVLINVEVAGIGGSEYLGFNNPGIRPLPNIMGHGITGTTANGRRVAIYPLQGCGKCDHCLEGRLQLCDTWSLIGVQSNGGFAQKLSVPKDSLFELPDNLSWKQSVFIEPFANSINAWNLSKAGNKESIAIIGAGSLGLGLVACASQNNCKTVHISDLSENRRLSAMELGATSSSETLDGEFNIVFDTVGSSETRSKTIQLAKKGGKCIFLGFETPMHELNMSEIIRHQKHLIGSFVYSKSQFNEAIKLAQNCDTAWVTNVTFHEVEKHLSMFLDNDFSKIKVALRPNQ